MKWECAERVMKVDYPLEVGFKADLSKKLIPVMELFRLFAEIVEWKNKFLLVSKTFVEKHFSRNGAFLRNGAGMC
ncbi:hypothetical protein RM549_18260 [Salegentibacter sp. F188]|jgi:hypothetical protein|uniref:Uncharacterized protein n=1 Tax=Autumnicola patrickiae TaxID=3075591 RepID=A0ABU3E747_9FLAO|nr:hypothetical protein [Salegentibacter sp. F188]MDT0691742.1 hypothetical protein [Salegentibacter sp. F188]